MLRLDLRELISPAPDHPGFGFGFGAGTSGWGPRGMSRL
jgi:hypothetical protein